MRIFVAGTFYLIRSEKLSMLITDVVQNLTLQQAGEIMRIDKFKAAERALIRFEQFYGPEVIKVFSTANGYISKELTDGMVAGVPQRANLDEKTLWVVPIVLSKKAGVYGEIGAILIDEKTLSILGMTAKSEILQKAEVLLGAEAKAA